MTKGTNKRGFIPPQPAAALSSLDFAAASQAFERALAIRTVSDDEADATGEIIASLADRLLGIPAQTPAEVAQKVRAYAWMNTLTADLADPDAQRRIAAGTHDPAKGLLAIYLDLAHSRADYIAQAYQPDWEAKLSRFHAADAAVEAAYGTDDETEPSDAQLAERRAARLALLDTRAPNAKALADKLALLIESQFTEEVGDSATSPATLSRMLADGPVEQWVASAYQDALALSGATGPLVEAKADPFDPKAWLTTMEATTGARLTVDGNRAHIQWQPRDGGTGLASAEAAFDALTLSQREKLSRFVFATRTPAPQPYKPGTFTPPADVRDILLDGYLNTFPQAERDAIRARLEGIA